MFFGIIALLILLNSSAISTPTELLQAREISNYKLQFDLLDKKINQLNIVLENIELVASRLDLEERLLHILNHCSSNRIPVLLTSNDFSSRAGFELKDLNSRLIATEHISIEQPDDALLSAVLIKQFNDRQIQISPSLIEFILKRITRSMASIGSFVEELDRTGLKLGKSANRAMISEVLDKFS